MDGGEHTYPSAGQYPSRPLRRVRGCDWRMGACAASHAATSERWATKRHVGGDDDAISEIVNRGLAIVADAEMPRFGRTVFASRSSAFLAAMGAALDCRCLSPVEFGKHIDASLATMRTALSRKRNASKNRHGDEAADKSQAEDDDFHRQDL
jgi:hypothetical protein